MSASVESLYAEDCAWCGPHWLANPEGTNSPMAEPNYPDYSVTNAAAIGMVLNSYNHCQITGSYFTELATGLVDDGINTMVEFGNKIWIISANGNPYPSASAYSLGAGILCKNVGNGVGQYLAAFGDQYYQANACYAIVDPPNQTSISFYAIESCSYGVASIQTWNVDVDWRNSLPQLGQILHSPSAYSITNPIGFNSTFFKRSGNSGGEPANYDDTVQSGDPGMSWGVGVMPVFGFNMESSGEGEGNCFYISPGFFFKGNACGLTNMVLNGPTNTPPVDTTTPKAWANFTNSSGGVFKIPLYQ